MRGKKVEEEKVNKAVQKESNNSEKNKTNSDNNDENLIKAKSQKLQGIKQTGEKIDLDKFKSVSPPKKKRNRILKEKIDPKNLKNHLIKRLLLLKYLQKKLKKELEKLLLNYKIPEKHHQ